VLSSRSAFHALCTLGLQDLARWQIEGSVQIVTRWSQQAANTAGQTCAVPFDTLARAIVGDVMGSVLHYLSDHDRTLAKGALKAFTESLVALAAPQPVSPRRRGPRKPR
jgi:hypothetical protein